MKKVSRFLSVTLALWVLRISLTGCAVPQQVATGRSNNFSFDQEHPFPSGSVEVWVPDSSFYYQVSGDGTGKTLSIAPITPGDLYPRYALRFVSWYPVPEDGNLALIEEKSEKINWLRYNLMPDLTVINSTRAPLERQRLLAEARKFFKDYVRSDTPPSFKTVDGLFKLATDMVSLPPEEVR